jgi:hypothetical protein
MSATVRLFRRVSVVTRTDLYHDRYFQAPKTKPTHTIIHPVLMRGRNYGNSAHLIDTLSSRAHSRGPLAVVELVQQPDVRPLVLPVGQIADVREKSIFRNAFNVMLPVQSCLKKYTSSRKTQITLTTPAIPSR